MQHTIAAVFDNRNSAQQALEQLVNAGFSRTDIRLGDTDANGATAAAPNGEETARDDGGPGLGIKHFFSQLFGRDDDETQRYADAVRRGLCVLTLDAPDESEVERAADIIEAHGPIDIDERATPPAGAAAAAMREGSGTYQQAGYSGQQSAQGGSSPNAQGDLSQGAMGARQGNLTQGAMQRADDSDAMSIPLLQEVLKVGKRMVRRGGVRIFQRTVETPVRDSVNLREEHASVERRAVDQPVDPANLAAFQENTFEVRENAEEAVVGKSVRVVEEVIVSKDVSERQEQISDTLRSSDVKIEQLDGAAADKDNDGAFRAHWSSGLAGDGVYEDYAPAYRYGYAMAGSALYQGRPWEDVEPDLRRNWESGNPASAWEKFKAAIREGWERMTG